MKLFSIPGRPTLARLIRFSTVVWAVVISVVAFVSLANFHIQGQRSGTNASSADVSALQTRMAELGEQLEGVRKQPPSLPQAHFDAAQKTLENRLASIEDTLGERAAEDDLTPLRERLGKIETRLESLKPPPKPAPGRAKNDRAKAASAALPFTVAGLELRGGEPFLSITPTSASLAAPMDVLHPGETLAAWQLEAIEGRTAVLRNGAQVRRVAVPKETR